MEPGHRDACLPQAGVLAKLAFAAQYFDPSEIEGAEKSSEGILTQ